jgi:hypothetical protein
MVLIDVLPWNTYAHPISDSQQDTVPLLSGLRNSQKVSAIFRIQSVVAFDCQCVIACVTIKAGAPNFAHGSIKAISFE